MVRPIEIMSAVSKAQETGRMQQNAQMRPESAQEFQKSLSAKLHLAEVHSPPPTSAADQVVLHPVGEEEKEKQRAAEDEKRESARSHDEETADGEDKSHGHDDEHSGHIDLKA